MMTTAGANKNPFRVQRFHALPYRAPGFDWETFWARLESFSFRGAIVGPHGTGKTTLLQELGAHLEKSDYDLRPIVLNDGDPRLHPRALRGVRRNTFVTVDGAEFLGPIAWRRLIRNTNHAAGLIITAHRSGRLPTVHKTKPDPAVLDELLHELAPEDAPALRTHAHELLARHDGNLREVWFALYHAWNAQHGSTEVAATYVRR